MTIKITRCSKEDVASLLAIAKKDGLNMASVKSECFWFIACDNEEPVGCAKVMRISASVARLGNIFVIERARNKGIGSALIDQTMLYISENGYKFVDCYCYKPNKYLTLGFKIVRQYKSSYGQTYHMRKSL